MTNRFEQSAPPSIHDVYRGLPIGPGGVEPFIFRDRGRHRRGPVRLPWRLLLLTCKRAYGHIIRLWRRVVAQYRAAGVAGARPVARRLRVTDGTLDPALITGLQSQPDHHQRKDLLT